MNGLALDERQPIAQSMKRMIDRELASIPDGKRGALIVIADMHGARAHLAAKLDAEGDWKLAFSAGKPWHGPVDASVMVMGSW